MHYAGGGTYRHMVDSSIPDEENPEPQIIHIKPKMQVSPTIL